MEVWFKPVLNVHTPLSPILTPVFLFAPLQLCSQEKLFLGRKSIGGGICPLPSYAYGLYDVHNDNNNNNTYCGSYPVVYTYKADTVWIYFVSQCRKDVVFNLSWEGRKQLNIRLSRTGHFHTSSCPVCVSLPSSIAFVQLVRVCKNQSTFTLSGQICRRRQPSLLMANKLQCYRHHWTRHTLCGADHTANLQCASLCLPFPCQRNLYGRGFL